MKFKHLNIFWKEAALFFITQVVGIFVALRLSKVLELAEIKPQSISFFNIFYNQVIDKVKDPKRHFVNYPIKENKRPDISR